MSAARRILVFDCEQGLRAEEDARSTEERERQVNCKRVCRILFSFHNGYGYNTLYHFVMVTLRDGSSAKRKFMIMISLSVKKTVGYFVVSEKKQAHLQPV